MAVPMDIDMPNNDHHPTTTTTSLPPPPTSDDTPETPTPNKKRKPKSKPAPHTKHTSTHRNPPWTYFTLRLHPSSPASHSTQQSPSASPPENPDSIDPLTTLTLLRTALHAFLGLTGSSIPLDILRTDGLDVTLRVANEDARGVRAALGTWVGGVEAELVPGWKGGGGAGEGKKVGVAWRVLGEAGALGGLMGGAGGDGAVLFG